MKLHYVYYAIKKDDKPKVGATNIPKMRPRIGKYKEFIILEAYKSPQVAGDREIELQLKYFGKRDNSLHYVEQLKIQEGAAEKRKETRKKNKTKIKITTKDIKRGHKTRKENQLKSSFIFRGKDNGYEPPKPKIPHLEKKSVGVNHQDAKLNPDKVREIRKRYARGNDTYQSIATDYGVTPAAITKVVKRISWRHVTDGQLTLFD